MAANGGNAENGDAVAADSTFSDLPKWQPRPEVYEEYPCQCCGQPSRLTRSYTVPLVLFGLVFWLRWTETVFECPRCIRRRLWRGLPIRLLLANMVAPIMLIWMGVLYGRSYSQRPFSVDN
jgi:hypothetical protein